MTYVLQNDKSVFYINEKNRWLISGIEEIRMFNGTKIVNRIRSGITRDEFFDYENELAASDQHYVRGPAAVQGKSGEAIRCGTSGMRRTIIPAHD